MLRNDQELRKKRLPCCVVLLALATLAGCVQAGPPEMRVDDRANPASLIDSYLIARGMALSYGHSGRASRADITQLVQYDRAALVAVVTAELQPGDGRDQQAERALQALVNFTGDNDLRPGPVGAPRPATAP